MRRSLIRLSVALYGAAVAALVVSMGPHRAADDSFDAGRRTRLHAMKMAALARFAPAAASEAQDAPESFADQDWFERSVDGAANAPPDFSAFATARNDWFGLATAATIPGRRRRRDTSSRSSTSRRRRRS